MKVDCALAGTYSGQRQQQSDVSVEAMMTAVHAVQEDVS